MKKVKKSIGNGKCEYKRQTSDYQVAKSAGYNNEMANAIEIWKSGKLV